MLDESMITNYYHRYGHDPGITMSDVRFAFHLVSLASGKKPKISEPDMLVIRVPALFKLTFSDKGYDYRDLLLSLCDSWLGSGKNARQSRCTLSFAEILKAISMWRSHTDLKIDWEESSSEALVQIATVGKPDAAIVEIGRHSGYLPNAHGGLKLVPDYSQEQQQPKILETIFLLQLARREMLSPDAYCRRFHPGTIADVIGCVLDIIASYSCKPVTSEVIRPADELCPSEADDMWFELWRLLPRRTEYRLKATFQPLNDTGREPLLTYLSAFHFVQLVVNNLDL